MKGEQEMLWQLRKITEELLLKRRVQECDVWTEFEEFHLVENDYRFHGFGLFFRINQNSSSFVCFFFFYLHKCFRIDETVWR